MTLPNFFVIGAMRSATTSYYSLLAQHPEIFFCEPKEPSFFVHNHDKGLDWYQSLYSKAADFPIRGDASTDYAKAPQFSGVPKQIAELCPEAKFAYLLRDPIDRMISQYVFGAHAGYEMRPISQAFRDNPSYLDNSRYAFQIQQYLEHFNRSQIHLVLTRDLASDPVKTVQQSLSFMGLPSTWIPETVNRSTNSTGARRRRRTWDQRLANIPFRTAIGSAIPDKILQKYRSAARTKFGPIDTEITPSTREWLLHQLSEDLNQLPEILGQPFDCWGLTR